MRVFVTVGMGPWPFDRLVSAVAALADHHDLFVQTGSSTVVPPCPHRAYISFSETLDRIRNADVVITHAGNTVRLVQRAGKIPIAVAREADRGEMRNDHQRAFLSREAAAGRVIVVDGELAGLVDVVMQHAKTERRLLAQHPPPPPADPHAAGQLIDELLRSAVGDALDKRALRRLPWAFSRLHDRTGRHLELGVGDGTQLRALAKHTALQCVGADPHTDHLRCANGSRRDVPLVQIGVGYPLPFADAAFDSVTMRDVLEHSSHDRRTLTEVRRILRPGGLLVLTVLTRNPPLRRLVSGDMARAGREHTSYRAMEIIELLTSTGFQPQFRDGPRPLHATNVFMTAVASGPTEP